MVLDRLAQFMYVFNLKANMTMTSSLFINLKEIRTILRGPTKK